MHIAQVTATFPPYTGGTGRVCLEYARGLVERGHTVDVYSAGRGGAAQETVDGITVHWLPTAGRIGNAPLTPALLQIGQPDIVHLHYPYVFGQELVLAHSLLRRSHLIITYHQDLIFSGPLDTAVKAHHTLVGRAILRRASRVIVTSLDYAASSRVAPLIAKRPDRVTEVSNGVNPRRFHPALDGRSIRERYGISSTDFVVLFVGGLDTPHYFKGVDVLLRAVAQAEEGRIRLLLVGDGNLRPRYEALARDLRISGRVTFCGYVSDEDLPCHYAAADLAVLPSTTRGEAFGIVLLEAMACAKPVIASNLPGVRSVVDQGSNGLLITPGDTDALSEAIVQLSHAPEQCAAMGERGRCKVLERYDWSSLADRLESIYVEVLQP